MEEIKPITSRENARLVLFRKVRDGKVRDQVYIEGLRLAYELLRSDRAVSQAVVAEEFITAGRGRELVDRLRAIQVPLFQVSEALFRSIADTVNPQGIALLAEKPKTGKSVIEDLFTRVSTPFLVFLSQINDPSNLGAVFRTAEAAGVSGIILSEGSANPFSPKSIRAAMGANLRLPVWEDAAIRDAFELAREKGLRIAAADIGGQGIYTDLDWARPVMAVFGSEAHGLAKEILSLVDDVFVIPMKNDVESLNLAVSCGVVLFEAVRQRNLASGRE